MNKTMQFFYWSILAIYLLLLIIVVFIMRDSLRSVNLIPFKTIQEFVFVDNGNGHIQFIDINVWGNIVMFIPLGVYLILHNRTKSWIHNFFTIVTISLAIEIIQYIFKLGASDIDDLILNSIGGLIGLFIYQLLFAILKDTKKVYQLIAVFSIVIGVPFIALVLLLIIVNA